MPNKPKKGHNIKGTEFNMLTKFWTNSFNGTCDAAVVLFLRRNGNEAKTQL